MKTKFHLTLGANQGSQCWTVRYRQRVPQWMGGNRKCPFGVYMRLVWGMWSLIKLLDRRLRRLFFIDQTLQVNRSRGYKFSMLNTMDICLCCMRRFNGQPVKLFKHRRYVRSAGDSTQQTDSPVLGKLQLTQDTAGQQQQQQQQQQQ